MSDRTEVLLRIQAASARRVEAVVRSHDGDAPAQQNDTISRDSDARCRAR